MRYELAYTDPKTKGREFEDFRTEKSALKRFKELDLLGATSIFIDGYDQDNDLIYYKCLKQ